MGSRPTAKPGAGTIDLPFGLAEGRTQRRARPRGRNGTSSWRATADHQLAGVAVAKRLPRSVRPQHEDRQSHTECECR